MPNRLKPDQLTLEQLTLTRQALLNAAADVCSRLNHLLNVPDITDRTRKRLEQELEKQERGMQDLERVLALSQPPAVPKGRRAE